MALHFLIAALDGGEHLVEHVDQVPDLVGRPRRRPQGVVLAARDAPGHLAQLQDRPGNEPLQPRRQQQRDTRRRHHDDGEDGDEADQPRAKFGEIGLEIDRADGFAVEHDLTEERQLLDAEHRLVGLNRRAA